MIGIRELARLRLNAMAPVYHNLIPRNVEVVMKTFLGQMTIFLVSSLIMIDLHQTLPLFAARMWTFTVMTRMRISENFTARVLQMPAMEASYISIKKKIRQSMPFLPSRTF